jgi:hypothetical protein
MAGKHFHAVTLALLTSASVVAVVANGGHVQI